MEPEKTPGVVEGAGPDTLKFPAPAGLVEVLDALRRSGRFGPGEWEEARRWLAAARTPRAGPRSG